MKEEIKKAILTSLKKLDVEDAEVEVNTLEQKSLGDLTSNIALKLAKVLKKNPMEIAELIKSNISNDNILKIEIKNPGFLNFFVKQDYLLANINKVIEENENYGRSNIGNGRKINIEFVSANPTGTLHLGNARGGAYGDNMARILAFAGFKVNKEYYINDAGNQIKNLGKSLKARYEEICGLESKMPEDGYYGEDIKKLAQTLYDENGKELLDFKNEFFEQYGIDKLMARIIDDLGEYRIKYDKFTSEKEIRSKDYVQKILAIYKEKDYSYESEGATWFKGTLFGSNRDNVLIKADGEWTYLLPDIAHHMDTIKQGYEKLINVLGADHHGYVPAITNSLKALGFENILDIKLLQLVRLIKDGEECRMSKRTGNAVTLKDLVEEVGVNAARYFFAARSLDTQMDFNIDLATKKTNENPVYYISYAYARICSVLKEKDQNQKIAKYETIKSTEAYNVLEKVYSFSEVVENAATKELPHLIANYAYDLANLFHIYYSKHRIITDDESETTENINMIKAVKITLFNALNLIGVIPPERM